MNKQHIFLMPLIIIHFCLAASSSEMEADIMNRGPCISLSLRQMLKGHSGWVTQLPTFKEDEQLSSEKIQFLNEIRLPKKDIQFYLSIAAENRGRLINRAHFKKKRDSRSASPIIERNRSQSPPRSGNKNSGH
ncbi:MAG TPA: hypothetical protein VHO47_03895 [Candidatus Babeliales bacterium]|nr:hypothetical protein [Candidatus Babeliales bacterium]